MLLYEIWSLGMVPYNTLPALEVCALSSRDCSSLMCQYYVSYYVNHSVLVTILYGLLHNNYYCHYLIYIMFNYSLW